MVRNLTERHDATEIPHNQRVKWYIKKNSHIFDVPSRINLYNDFVIVTNSWEPIDHEELHRNFYKF
jgi:hypothetical protein